MSAHYRTFLLTLLMLLAGFISISVFLLREGMRKRLSSEIDDELKSRVFALSRLVEMNAPRLQPYVEQGLGSTPGGVYLQLFAPDGMLLSSSSNLSSPLPLPETVRKLASERFEIILADSSTESGEPVRTATFARNNNGSNNREIFFYAQAGLPTLPRLDNTLREVSFQLFACGGGLWIVACLATWWSIKHRQNSIRQFVTKIDAIDPTSSLHPHLLQPETIDQELCGLATSIKQLLEKLATVHKTQQQFVAEASHELRTPLAILLGENDVILRRERSATDYRETLQSNREEIARLSKIVNNLLLLARSDAGEHSLPSAPVNLHTLCGEVCDQLGSLAEVRRVKLTLSPEPIEPAIAMADQLSLQRAISNLVENAIAATPPEESVHVSVVGTDAFWEIQVEDTGYGIESDHLPKIFERFYRTDTARARGLEGAGLGLAIVLSIVHAHNGSIDVKSRPGKGSLFVIKLPRSTIEN